jgi:cytochrome bd ubiquinol oxidase subunit I
VFVIAANSWMNTPAGFVLENGKATQVDPLKAMLNPHFIPQALHMVLSAFAATGFAVAGIHAFILLRKTANTFHRGALAIALAVGGLSAVLLPLSGDYLAKEVAKHQPAKLAAMEGHFHTQKRAPLHIGGLPDEEKMETPYAIELPAGLSLLAFSDLNAEVQGLEEFPKDEWPPVLITHIAFQIMVGCGVAMMFIGAWTLYRYWKKKDLAESRLFLKAVVAASPLGIIGVEAGWTVTEVGRQPWIIYGVMKTAEAVTPMPGLVIPFVTFTILYILLSLIVVWLLLQLVRQSPGMAKSGFKDSA